MGNPSEFAEVARGPSEFYRTFCREMERKIQRAAEQAKTWDLKQFWLEQIGNLALRYPLFCQENTYQTSKVISGLEKFPVQYWNNPGEKLSNANNRQGLELKDLGVAGFFYKSGFKSLESQKIVTANKSLTMGHAGGSGGANSSNRFAGVSQGTQNEANQTSERQSQGSRRG